MLALIVFVCRKQLKNNFQGERYFIDSFYKLTHSIFSFLYVLGSFNPVIVLYHVFTCMSTPFSPKTKKYFARLCFGRRAFLCPKNETKGRRQA